jgi:hypothetical protein
MIIRPQEVTNKGRGVFNARAICRFSSVFSRTELSEGRNWEGYAGKGRKFIHRKSHSNMKRKNPESGSRGGWTNGIQRPLFLSSKEITHTLSFGAFSFAKHIKDYSKI